MDLLNIGQDPVGADLREHRPLPLLELGFGSAGVPRRGHGTEWDRVTSSVTSSDRVVQHQPPSKRLHETSTAFERMIFSRIFEGSPLNFRDPPSNPMVD